MFTNHAIGDSLSDSRKKCQYCHQKINSKDERPYNGSYYHASCKEKLVMATKHPELFRLLSEIKTATDYLLEAPPSWVVKNSGRVITIYNALKFILKFKALNNKHSHNPLN